MQVIKQAWWAPVAGLLVLVLIAIAGISGFSGSEDTESRVAGAAIALLGALVLAAGLWKRPEARGLGNALVVAGALSGAFWFWFLPAPVLAIIVVIGVAASEVRSPARGDATS